MCLKEGGGKAGSARVELAVDTRWGAAKYLWLDCVDEKVVITDPDLNSGTPVHSMLLIDSQSLALYLNLISVHIISHDDDKECSFVLITQVCTCILNNNNAL